MVPGELLIWTGSDLLFTRELSESYIFLLHEEFRAIEVGQGAANVQVLVP